MRRYRRSGLLFLPESLSRSSRNTPEREWDAAEREVGGYREKKQEGERDREKGRSKEMKEEWQRNFSRDGRSREK